MISNDDDLARRVLDMAATDTHGSRLEETTYEWLRYKTAGHIKEGSMERTGAWFTHTRGDGGRDIEYKTLRGDTVRVDSKVAMSNVGVGRVSQFSGRLESKPGNVTGMLVVYPADFSAEAKKFLLETRARTFIGSQVEARDVVLISGDSLAEQMDVLQQINSGFRDVLRKLERRWTKVDGVPSCSPSPSVGTVRGLKRSRAATPSSSVEDTCQISVDSSSTDSDSDGDSEDDVEPKRRLVAPHVGMRVWLNLKDRPDDRPAETGTYEATVKRITDGRTKRIFVQIDKRIVCARPPAAPKQVSGPNHPTCADESNVVVLNSLTVHELWTPDGKYQLAHPYSERLKSEQAIWHELYHK